MGITFKKKKFQDNAKHVLTQKYRKKRTSFKNKKKQSVHKHEQINTFQNILITNKIKKTSRYKIPKNFLAIKLHS